MNSSHPMTRPGYPQVSNALSITHERAAARSPKLVQALATNWDELKMFVLDVQRATARAYADDTPVAGAVVIGISHLLDQLEKLAQSPIK